METNTWWTQARQTRNVTDLSADQPRKRLQQMGRWFSRKSRRIADGESKI